MGLPSSGKSTFIAALYHRLRQPAGPWRLSRLPDERDYLIDVEEQWLSLSPLGRSGHHGPKNIQLEIVADTDEFQLNIPDIVGEDYAIAWESGDWSDPVLGAIKQSQGILLCIRSDIVTEATLIEVAPKAQSRIDEVRKPWEPKDAPTQAILCDLLEQVREIRLGHMPSLAILVTAWDAVAQVGLAPDDWLAWQLPLLSQWLRSQPDVTYRVFGISSQGGDVRKHEVQKELAQFPDERPIPKNGHDLTAPLEWLRNPEATTAS